MWRYVARAHEAGKSSVYPIVGLLGVLFVASNTFSSVARSIWHDVGNNWLYSYTWISERFSSSTMAVAGNAVLHLLAYWPLALAFCALDLVWPRAAARYKVQPNEHATADDYRRIYKRVLFNQFCVAFPVAALQHYLSEWRSGGTYTLASAWPSFWEFVLHIAAILLVEEILFYYTHRLAHWGPLYKWVHKEHHRFTAPVAMSAIYCHPLEHLACNLLPVHAGPLLMGSHLSVCAAWYVFAVLNTVNTHSGYHLPLLPSPESHDYHHLTFNNCYGVLGILDYLHGTDVRFRASEQFQRHVMIFPGQAALVPERVAVAQEVAAEKMAAASDDDGGGVWSVARSPTPGEL